MVVGIPNPVLDNMSVEKELIERIYQCKRISETFSDTHQLKS